MNSYNNRENLKFNFNVRNNFQFLIDDYNFEFVKEDFTFVRYETDQLFVNIYHGRLSYELGFECGLKSKGEDSRFRLNTILRGLIGDTHNKQTFYQASNKEAVANCLSKISDIVKKYCFSLLRAEDLAFVKVDRASADEGQELTEKYTLGFVREQAEQAWRNKEYKKVRSLYKTIEEKLSYIELKRLKYADNYLGSKSSDFVDIKK